MDHQDLGVFIPLLALFIPIVAIVMGSVSKIRRDRELHETVRQLTLQGKEIPPALFNSNPFKDIPSELLNQQLAGKRMAGEWTPKRQLRAAIINIGAALGLGGLLFAASPQGWFWAIGLLPLCIGLALLLLWKIESGKPTA